MSHDMARTARGELYRPSGSHWDRGVAAVVMISAVFCCRNSSFREGSCCLLVAHICSNATDIRCTPFSVCD